MDDDLLADKEKYGPHSRCRMFKVVTIVIVVLVVAVLAFCIGGFIMQQGKNISMLQKLYVMRDGVYGLVSGWVGETEKICFSGMYRRDGSGGVVKIDPWQGVAIWRGHWASGWAKYTNLPKPGIEYSIDTSFDRLKRIELFEMVINSTGFMRIGKTHVLCSNADFALMCLDSHGLNLIGSNKDPAAATTAKVSVLTPSSATPENRYVTGKYIALFEDPNNQPTVVIEATRC